VSSTGRPIGKPRKCRSCLHATASVIVVPGWGGKAVYTRYCWECAPKVREISLKFFRGVGKLRDIPE